MRSLSFGIVSAVLIAFLAMGQAPARADSGPVITWVSQPAAGATSLGGRGSLRPSITPDANYTAYMSAANDFGTPSSGDSHMHIYRTNTITKQTVQVDLDSSGQPYSDGSGVTDQPIISPNGAWVVWNRIIPGVGEFAMLRNLVTQTSYEQPLSAAVASHGGMIASAVANDGKSVLWVPNVPTGVDPSWVPQGHLFTWSPQSGTLTQLLVSDASLSPSAIGFNVVNNGSVSLSADGATLVANAVVVDPTPAAQSQQASAVVKLTASTVLLPFPSVGTSGVGAQAIGSSNGRYVVQFSQTYYDGSPDRTPYAGSTLAYDVQTGVVSDVTPTRVGLGDHFALQSVPGAVSDDGHTVLVAPGMYNLDPANERPLGHYITYIYDYVARTFKWLRDDMPSWAAGNAPAIADFTSVSDASHPHVNPGSDNDVYVESLQPIVATDSTPPTVTVVGAASGATYAWNHAPNPVCSTTDDLSGVATDATLNVTHTGTSYTATCSGAVDVAGNAAAAVSVSYTVNSQPVGTVVVMNSTGDPLASVPVKIRSASGVTTSLATDADGVANATLAAATYTASVTYATGTSSKALVITSGGQGSVTFQTVPVTVRVVDSFGTPLTSGTVSQAGNSGTFNPRVPVAANGQLVYEVLPGTNSFTAWFASSYQTKQLTVVAGATNVVNFHTVAATVNVNDPVVADLAAATVTQAGKTGVFGPKTPVDGSGNVVFQVLAGTNSFTAWVAGGYQTQTVTVPDAYFYSVGFTAYAVTAHVSNSNGSQATNAQVSHAGNTGTFSPKVAVDGSGNVTFYCLPGTSTFTAWIGSSYKSSTMTVSGAASLTIAF